MYEHAAQVPLVLAGPDAPNGKVVKTAVSHLDVHQTILNCVGLPPSDADRSLPGASLYKIAAAPDDAGRAVFSEYHAAGAPTGSFLMRRGRYKLIYYVDMAPELFDLEADPEEMNDLAGDPAHRSLVAELEALLRQVGDPEEIDRRAKADQAALVAKHGGRDAVLKRGAFGGTPAPGYKAEYEAGAG
jgi:choline-sulfatase